MGVSKPNLCSYYSSSLLLFENYLTGHRRMLQCCSSSSFSTNLYRQQQQSRRCKSNYSHTVQLPKTAFPTYPKEKDRKRWDEKVVNELTPPQQIYDRQMKDTMRTETFQLLDGPPYANGAVHVGHALNKITKDIILRYQLMHGRQIIFQPGWDCHGLPIELKAVRTDPTKDTQPMDIRRKAADLATETIEAQRAEFIRWNVLGDWKNPYKTYDAEYEAREVSVFQALYNAGLIYRNLYPVWWSPSTKTALAEAEVEYNDSHQSLATYFRLQLINFPDQLKPPGSIRLFAIVYTTTPWTLVCNNAVAYSEKIQYALVRPTKYFDSKYRRGDVYLIAEDRVGEVLAEIDRPPDCMEVLSVVDGAALANVIYDAPPTYNTAHYCRADNNLVKAGVGTGLVHCSYAHGFQDYLVGLRSDADIRCFVDEEGRYTRHMGPGLSGRYVLEDRGQFVLDYEHIKNNVLSSRLITHSYPYDWRTKQPLICRTSKQWFLNRKKIYSQCRRAVDDIRFHSLDGASLDKQALNQFINNRPWCLSRQRVWGLPIPMLLNAETDEIVDSPELQRHLHTLIRDNGSDIWWTAEDDQLLPNEIRQSMKLPESVKIARSTDVLDVWFDSGCAWSHSVRTKGQADLIVEGIDQFRGWFTSLLTTGVPINGKGKAPYRAVLSHGFAVDDAGKKMSKSAGNVLEPKEVMDGRPGGWYGMGVDGLRWWTVGTGVHRVGPESMERVVSELKTVRLALRFVLGNTWDYDPSADGRPSQQIEVDRLPYIDQYAVYLISQLVQEAEPLIATYRFSDYRRLILDFIDNFSTVYLFAVKDRLYCHLKNSQSRRQVQFVLKHYGDVLMKLMYPIVPNLYAEYCTHQQGFRYAQDYGQLEKDNKESLDAGNVISSLVDGDDSDRIAPVNLPIDQIPSWPTVPELSWSGEIEHIFEDYVLPIQREFRREFIEHYDRQSVTVRVHSALAVDSLQNVHPELGSLEFDSQLIDLLDCSSLTLVDDPQDIEELEEEEEEETGGEFPTMDAERQNLPNHEDSIVSGERNPVTKFSRHKRVPYRKPNWFTLESRDSNDDFSRCLRCRKYNISYSSTTRSTTLEDPSSSSSPPPPELCVKCDEIVKSYEAEEDEQTKTNRATVLNE